MSESTRDKKNGTRRSGKRSGQDIPFFAISIVIHAVFIGAVLWIAPVRDIFFEREKPEEPEIITSGDELETIVEDIRDRTVEQLKMRVQLLDMGQDRMANNFRILNEYHQPFAEQQRATAYLRFSEYADDVLTRQKELMEALNKAKETKDYDKAIETSFANVSQIFTAQEEVRRGIQLLGIEDEALMEKQRQVEDSQITSENAQRWFAQAVNSVEKMEKQLAETREQLPKDQTRFKDIQNEVNRMETEQNKLKDKIKTLKDEHDGLRRKKPENWQEKQKEVQEKRKKLETEMKKLNTGSLKRDMRDIEKQVERAQQRIEDLKAKLPERKREALEHLQLAINTQTSVYYKQKEIIEAVRAMIDKNGQITTTLGDNNQ
jgi:predicted  nucleic acid-binding Zn-ribbon protein